MAANRESCSPPYCCEAEIRPSACSFLLALFRCHSPVPPVLPFPASRAHRYPFVHPLVGGSAPNSPSFRPCRARNENTNGRANARPPVFESNLSESRFSLLLPQQVFIQRQRLCMHLFGHGLAGFGRGGLFGLRRIGGGRRSPRPPENSASYASYAQGI